MIKNLSRLDLSIDGKEAWFFCENDCSTQMAKEMLFKGLKFIGQIEDNAKAQQEALKAQEESKVTPIAEEKAE